MLQQLVVAIEMQPCPVVLLTFFGVLEEMVHLLELAVTADGDKFHVLALGIDAVLEMRHRLYLALTIGVSHPDESHIDPLPFHALQRHLHFVHVGQGEERVSRII